MVMSGVKRYGKRNAEIVRRAMNGESVRDLSVVYGLSEKWVQLIVRWQTPRGWWPERVGYHGRKTLRNREIVRRAQGGESYIQIAADYGVTASRVSGIARAGGVRRRSWPLWFSAL